MISRVRDGLASQYVCCCQGARVFGDLEWDVGFRQRSCRHLTWAVLGRKKLGDTRLNVFWMADNPGRPVRPLSPSKVLPVNENLISTRTHSWHQIFRRVRPVRDKVPWISG